jgi:hypothetical protein
VAIYGQDENTVALFRLMAGFCISIAIVFGIWSLWKPGGVLVPLMIGPLGLLFLTSSRYAIIFSPTEFVVRPQFGAPTRIPYSSITRLTNTTVPAGQYGSTPAVILGLPFGQTYLLRLNVENSQEMLRRLQEATGKHIV